MSNRCQIDPRGGEGEADSRVGSGGPVPNKPLTIIGMQRFLLTVGRFLLTVELFYLQLTI